MRRNKLQSGFTFIETMVVLIIVGIIATFAAITLSSFTNSPSLKDTAERFKMRFNAARLQAIIRPANIGILINKNGFQMLQLKRNLKDKGLKWFSLYDDKVSDPNGFAKMTVKTAQNKSDTPQILINPNGLATPFQFTISQKDKTKIINITKAGSVDIK